MPRFVYKAKKGPSDLVEGIVEAESRRRAIDILRGRGCFPVSVEEEAAPSGFRRIRPGDVALFTRQMSDLLDSGLPLLRALGVARKQTENPKLEALVGEVEGEVREGKALSAAMEEHPDVFPAVYTSVLRAGEIGGAVAGVLDQLAEFYEKEADFRSRVATAAAYPLLIALVGAGTLAFLISFVIPRMSEMFGEMGQSLPWITRLMLSVSAFWIETWWIWLLVGAVGAAAWVRFRPPGGVLWRLPLWRRVAYGAAVARFARTLETLACNGVPLLDALRVAADSVGHPMLEKQIRAAAREVEDGSTLAEGLQGRLPEFACHMIAVGEEGGKLERSLKKVAAAYEKDFERAVRLATAMLEPAMILGVGVLVGGMVLAMLLPILNMHTLIK